MFNELSKWLPAAALLTAAFALGFAVLAPRHHREGTRGPITPFPLLGLDVSVGGPLWAPLWALFAHVEPSDLDPLPGDEGGASAFFAPIWLCTYLVLMLALLANALIAAGVHAYAAAASKDDTQ